ncbi:hypothetical protein MJM25_29005, partial [Salmonella enterica subsp. enterica serovar Lubbock]|nr:hypothetical protein [Salmonella enterica subsp. enterica serovar Lubbock]
FSSLSNGFLVDQVFRTNVFRDGVTTPGTTTQRQGRCEFEVVQCKAIGIARNVGAQYVLYSSASGNVNAPALQMQLMLVQTGEII